MTDTERLLPCPFCGERPDIDRDDDGDFYVYCLTDRCPAYIENSMWSWVFKEQAIAAWNRRSPVAAAPPEPAHLAVGGEQQPEASATRASLSADGGYDLLRQARDCMDRIVDLCNDNMPEEAAMAAYEMGAAIDAAMQMSGPEGRGAVATEPAEATMTPARGGAGHKKQPAPDAQETVTGPAVARGEHETFSAGAGKE